ncbi:hypothetical protein [Mesobacillus subterraneus]|uniref:Lipoprotein n=1 Tax=Mesobacillus subterraneus TaxID=285983 RepID=A0A3R9EZ30_9BACI|nr:hypothetical protein [Mesobacillus subterraneus]RSD25457.1 hypothetical protein EJA10_16760 [Mesobacillus subterraneus]
MKKIWILLSAILLTISLTACSSDSKQESAPEKTETEEAAKPAVNPKSVMYKFYMNIVNTINASDAELNAYEGAEEPTAEEKAAASTSAAKVAEELKKLEVPEELKDQKADLEAAVQDLADSYNVKAEELKKDAPSFEAADEKFAQGEEKIGTAFESIEMKRPSLAKEL